jgi:eukaryotic-like serine/threonine-protein kinase
LSSSLVGQTLLSRFRVDAFIASGAMGDVYKVWDLQRNVALAIKVLHADLVDDPTMIKAFKRDANALEKLAHPNIVPFYGFYQTSDFLFLLMSFIDGPSLKEILHSRGKPLDVSEALAYLKAVSAALGYAHAKAVVHCDVKPGNVMVNNAGQIYLTDFGIARHAESTTTTLAGAGTVSYMAPEQITAAEVTPATDVYALGIMLFEMLTGKRPYRGADTGVENTKGTTEERIRHAHLFEAPPDPCKLNPAIPAPLGQVILKALAKQPAQRYANAPTFFEAVCHTVNLIPAQIADRVTPLQSEKAPEIYISPVKPGRQRKPIAWIGGIVFLMIIILGFLLFRPGSSNHNSNVTFTNVPTIQSSPWIITATPLIASNTPNIFPTPTPSGGLDPGTWIISEEVRTDWTPICTSIGDQWASPTDGMMLLCVPGGEFLSGPNKDPLTSAAFWIDQTEVTNGMYEICVQAKACSPPYPSQASNEPTNYFGNPQGSAYPVTRVTWQQAVDYCTWAGRRLLSQSEWEKAARGTDGRTYPWGERINCSMANIQGCENSYSTVGLFPSGASPFGVLDMAGNVFEWVRDSCDKGHAAVGGSWYDHPEEATTFNQRCRTSDSHSSKLGFRCGK